MYMKRSSTDYRDYRKYDGEIMREKSIVEAYEDRERSLIKKT